jgi:hypothetical protein
MPPAGSSVLTRHVQLFPLKFEDMADIYIALYIFQTAMPEKLKGKRIWR